MSLDTLDARVAESLRRAGIAALFPVQAAVVPAALAQRDVLVRSPTGSGKTLAYAIPIAQTLLCTPPPPPRAPRLRALVVVPTRDVAAQVAAVFAQLFTGALCGLCAASAVGGVTTSATSGNNSSGNNSASGSSMGEVLGAEALGAVDVLVATPGRLLELLGLGRSTYSAGGDVSLEHLRFLVVDEADRMLGSGDSYQEWIPAVMRLAHNAVPGVAPGTASADADTVRACRLPHPAGAHRARLAQPALFPLAAFGGAHAPAPLYTRETPRLQRLLFSATLVESTRRLLGLRMVNPFRYDSAVVPVPSPGSSAAAPEAPKAEAEAEAEKEDINKGEDKEDEEDSKTKAAESEAELDADLLLPLGADALVGDLGLQTSVAVEMEEEEEKDEGEKHEQGEKEEEEEEEEQLCPALAPLVSTGGAGLSAKAYVMPETLVQHAVVCEGMTRECWVAAAIVLTGALADAHRQVLCFASGIDTAHATAQFLAQLFARAAAASSESSNSESSSSTGAARVAEYSSELSKRDRERTLARFRRGRVQVLVTTDVLARGVDLPGVDAVLNLDCPRHIRTYVHRAGRTARAGSVGHVYTVLATRELAPFRAMLRETGAAADTLLVQRYTKPDLEAIHAQYIRPPDTAAPEHAQQEQEQPQPPAKRHRPQLDHSTFHTTSVLKQQQQQHRHKHFRHKNAKGGTGDKGAQPPPAQ